MNMCNVYMALDTSTSSLTISRPDVADFILKQLRDNTYLRKAASLSY